MPRVTLFAGPSAFGIPRETLLRDTRLCPPARRGDIDRLITETELPGVLVVCDGVFQSEPAVSHAEICRALDADWKVWGVSSIGAIRAFELRDEGMQGSGYVYSLFGRFDDFTDDEMCLLHFPEDPYFAVSEPLVNLRYALERRKAQLGISDGSEAKVLSALRELWFGYRTEEKIRSVMVEEADVEPAIADTLLAWLKQNRVKALDLSDLMTRRPWTVGP
jgi:hypothetical protein